LRNCFGILLFTAFPLILLTGLGSREPSFDGKSLRNWTGEMIHSWDGPKKDAAREVVRKLGNHSLPLLLEWLHEKEQPSATEQFDEVRQKVLFWLMRNRLWKNGSITSLQDLKPSHKTTAIWVLPELDAANQRAAIPVLIQMLEERKSKQIELSENAGAAFCVLSKMNPEAIPPLIDALSSKDFQAWALAATALAAMGPDAKAAIPVLQKRLDDKDANVRMTAAYSIGKLGADPAIFVPVVIQDLRDPDRDGLDYKLEILVNYKEHAKSAVPILNEMQKKTAGSTNVQDIMVWGWIENALPKIRDSGDK
jgi:hypothetical protein